MHFLFSLFFCFQMLESDEIEKYITEIEKEREEEAEKKKAAASANIQQTGEDMFVWTDENSNPSTPLKRSSKKASSL